MPVISSIWNLLKNTVRSWSDDHAPSMGAALAYYTMFSIAPLLLIAISVAGLVFGADAARGEIAAQLEGLMGSNGARAVQSLLESVNKPAQGITATLIGVSLSFIGASTVIAELQSDLDRIWRAPQIEKSGGVKGFVKTRLLTVSVILGMGFLLMVSLLASTILAALEKWWAPWFAGWDVLARLLDHGIGFVLATTAFAMIYKVMPRAKIAWRDVWVGAAVTAILFGVGKYLIGLYIGRSAVGSTFGAAGSLVAMLVWVYYSAQIFLLGAEFTWVYAHAHGSREGQQRPTHAQ